MEEIKPGTFRYENRPVFVRWPADDDGSWHVWGPENLVAEGQVSEVYRYQSDEVKPVEIIEHVAERMVARRGGDRVRFVLATFDRVVEEE